MIFNILFAFFVAGVHVSNAVEIEVFEVNMCDFENELNSKYEINYDPETKTVNGFVDIQFDFDETITYNGILYKDNDGEWLKFQEQEGSSACKGLQSVSPTGLKAFLENIKSSPEECSIKKGKYEFKDFSLLPSDIKTVMPGYFKADIMLMKETTELGCISLEFKMAT